MKLSIAKETFLAPLQTVIGAIEGRQTLPILSNVLLQAKGDEIIFTATDLEIELTCTYPHDAIETGEITLPAKKLTELVKALPEGSTINFSREDHLVKLSAGRSRFNLSCLSAEDFPRLNATEEGNTLTVPRKELKEMMQAVEYAMAAHDPRYFLNGMLLDVSEEGMTAVATDGHRLACASLILSDPPSLKCQFIIPSKGVKELLKLLDNESAPVHLRFNTNHLEIGLGSTRFVTKLIDGKYPQYQRVIPENNNKIIGVDRLNFIRSLERVSILAHDKFRNVRLKISDWNMLCSVYNDEQEQAEEELEINYQGDTLEISFNISYLLDALRTLSTEMVYLYLSDAETSCLLQNAESDAIKYVVMPIRL